MKVTSRCPFGLLQYLRFPRSTCCCSEALASNSSKKPSGNTRRNCAKYQDRKVQPIEDLFFFFSLKPAVERKNRLAFTSEMARVSFNRFHMKTPRAYDGKFKTSRLSHLHGSMTFDLHHKGAHWTDEQKRPFIQGALINIIVNDVFPNWMGQRYSSCLFWNGGTEKKTTQLCSRVPSWELACHASSKRSWNSPVTNPNAPKKHG